MMDLSTTRPTAKRRPRSVSLCGVLALALLVVTITEVGAAAADSWEDRGRAACTRDAFVRCPLQALAGDRAHVRDCLVAKLGRLSEACRSVINAALAGGGQAPAAPDSPRTPRSLAIKTISEPASRSFRADAQAGP